MQSILARGMLGLVFITKAAIAQVAPTVITDLPFGVTVGDEVEITLIENIPADAAFLRVCSAMRATCTVSVPPNFNVGTMGFVCSGSAGKCWFSFLGALRTSGAKVLTTPARGGASFQLFYVDETDAPIGN